MFIYSQYLISTKYLHSILFILEFESLLPFQFSAFFGQVMQSSGKKQTLVIPVRWANFFAKDSDVMIQTPNDLFQYHL